MLFRVQADAGLDGVIQASSIEVFDAPLLIDPVTDQPRRGDLRQVDLSLAIRQRIADAINAELAGTTKAAERLTETRNKERQRREETAVRAPKDE
jgi:hypothetical protein